MVTAVARVVEIQPNSTTGLFDVDIRWIRMDSNQVGAMTVTGLTPGILSVVFEATLVSNIKSALSLGLLDNVRLLGSTLV